MNRVIRLLLIASPILTILAVPALFNGDYLVASVLGGLVVLAMVSRGLLDKK